MKIILYGVAALIIFHFIIYILGLIFTILTSPTFWIILIILAFIYIGIDSKIKDKREKQDRRRRDERERQELIRRARTKLKFMDAKVLAEIDGFQFEDYFSEQLNNLEMKNKALPKSGDFGVDTLVYAKDDYAVQLKHYQSSTVGVSAVQEVFAGASYYGNMIPVILTTGRYTKSAEELAIRLDIELIDSSDIIHWHNSYYKRQYNHVENGLYKEVKNKLEIKLK